MNYTKLYKSHLCTVLRNAECGCTSAPFEQAKSTLLSVRTEHVAYSLKKEFKLANTVKKVNILTTENEAL